MRITKEDLLAIQQSELRIAFIRAQLEFQRAMLESDAAAADREAQEDE